MIINTVWPGATAQEVSEQVTERIEKKLMETGEFEKVISFSRPGESQVTFVARDSLSSEQVPELWYQIRKKIGEIIWIITGVVGYPCEIFRVTCSLDS